MRFKNAVRSQRGAVTLVEAAFVLPITFIVVFAMLMAGEGFYQHSRAEYAVIHAAVQGAARCENPMLSYVEKNGNTVSKDVRAVKILPYRYIWDSEAQSITDEVESDLKKTIESQKPLFFRGMSPSSVRVSANSKVSILISSMKIQCDFEIQLPIRMIFSNENFKFEYSVYTEEAIGDPAELVRNVSTVKDVMERSAAVTQVFQKIGSGLEKIFEYLN